MGRLFQLLLFFLAACTENELRRHIEFLKAENQKLRKRIPKQHNFLSRNKRERLHKLGKTIDPCVANLITIVDPRTHQQRIPNSSDGSSRKRMDRPGTLEPIRGIVIRIAKWQITFFSK